MIYVMCFECLSNFWLTWNFITTNIFFSFFRIIRLRSNVLLNFYIDQSNSFWKKGSID